MISLNHNIKPLSQDLLQQLPPKAASLVLEAQKSPQPIIRQAFGQAQLNQTLTIVEYSLGEQILEYQPSKQPSDNKSKARSPSPKNTADRFVGIVCQGRVRLLVSSGEKEITAELLSEDQSFGADHLLIPQPFGYRAMASSPIVKVAQVPLSIINSLLKTSQSLKQCWLEQTQIRDRLCFFRTSTALKSQPSHLLKQWIPYLQVLTIEKGSNLSSTALPKTGHYWLRSGDISGELSPPAVGDSWGYSGEQAISNTQLNSVEPSWTAAEDSVIYQLPLSAWTIAKAFTPDLDTAQRQPNQPRSHQQQASSAPRSKTLLEDLPKKKDERKNGDTPSTVLRTAGKRLSTDAIARSSSPSHIQSQQSSTAGKNELRQSKPAVLFPKPPQRLILDALHHYPWVEQQSSSDCGAACLSMVSRYWGKRFPLNALREKAQVGREGVTLKSLAKAAESIGFQARPVRASLGALVAQQGPWIAHWEGNHFVVVYKITDHKVLIGDPALGKKAVSRETFTQKWTSYGLLLEPTLQLQKTNIKQGSLGRYMQALAPYKGLIFQIILVSLLIQCFSLLSPLFTQIILDRVVVQKSLSTLNVFVVGLFIFGLWGLVMGAVRQYLLSYFSNRLDLTLISGFIRHTMALPMRFFESRRVGDIITRVQENQKIQQFLIGQVVLAWLGFVTGFVYLGLMLYYNLQLTLLVLMMVPPIIIITLGATPFLRRISREIFKEAADQNSALVEMIGGISTIKSTATEHEMRWRWENNLTRLLNARFRGQKFGIGLQSVSGCINSIGSTILLWYGARLVILDQLTIGQFVAFNMMIGYVISPVISLANLWDELQEIYISIERLNDVFEAKPEGTDRENMMVMPPVEGAIALESVTFRYSEESDRNTLQNISFEVSPGATVAIVGRSGSGKSTLVKLLEGLYQPKQGRVLIDGHDIRHVVPASLRSQLGVVPQDCVLFSGTILENISLFRDNVPLESVVKAAKLAEAHSFIQSLPLGYSTTVGERGASLSGGQRQRIAITRALLKQPKILLLDEATSSLDTESERHFQQNLERISADITTIIIAHRLSTVRNADCILVLDRGILVEQGTHSKLMERKGLYHSLAEQQLDL